MEYLTSNGRYFLSLTTDVATRNFQVLHYWKNSNSLQSIAKEEANILDFFIM
jgi:hypothetical protein